MAYAEKRGKTWRARWQLPEKGPDGRAREGSEPGFRTKKEAERYALDQEAAIRAGTWIDPKRGETTLGEWWQTWFAAQEFRPNTAEAYAQQWRRHIEPRWGSTPLRSMRGIDIEAWLKELRGTLSASTVTVITSAMRGALDSAVFNEMIPRSPMPPLQLHRGRKAGARTTPTRQGVVVPLDAVERILERMRGEDERLIVVMALMTGMRWSEVAGMRLRYLTLAPAGEDGTAAAGHYLIDPVDGALHEDVHGRPYFGPPKSGADHPLASGFPPGRVIDLPPGLVELLLAYTARLRATDEGLLFPNTKGGPRSYDTWNHTRWRPACDGRPASVSPTGRSVRAAVPPVWPGLRFHDLKHTHKAIMNDLRIHHVMQDYRLGHVTPGTPGRYSHPTELMRRELVDGLQTFWEKWQAPATPSSLPLALTTGALDNVLF